MLAPRDIDEYLLPTERRVIRVRQHVAVMLKDVLVTALFLLLMVVAQRHLPAGVPEGVLAVSVGPAPGRGSAGPGSLAGWALGR